MQKNCMSGEFYYCFYVSVFLLSYCFIYKIPLTLYINFYATDRISIKTLILNRKPM